MSVSSRLRFFCSFIVLAWTASLCSAEDKEEAALREELLAVPSQIASVPDCAIAYHTWYEGGASGGMHRKHSFFKQGARWREETHTSFNKLISVVSFDGEDYYLYRPEAGYLLVSRDPQPMEKEIALSYSYNPLYCYFTAFFFRTYSNTRMPELGSAAVWRDHLESFTIKPLSDVMPGHRRFSIDGSEVKFDVTIHTDDSGQIAIPTFTRLLKEVADPSTIFQDTCEGQMNHWITVPVNGTNAIFPTHVTGRARNGQGSWSTVGNVVVRYVQDSLRPLPDDLPAIAFRVPLKLVPRPIRWKNPEDASQTKRTQK